MPAACTPAASVYAPLLPACHCCIAACPPLLPASCLPAISASWPATADLYCLLPHLHDFLPHIRALPHPTGVQPCISLKMACSATVHGNGAAGHHCVPEGMGCNHDLPHLQEPVERVLEVAPRCVLVFLVALLGSWAAQGTTQLQWANSNRAHSSHQSHTCCT